jgi:hypothetical protein
VGILDHPDWRRARPIVRDRVQLLTENAPLATVTGWDALTKQTEACATLGLRAHRLYDWRHTYAVNAIWRGDDHQDIRRQFGHAPNSMMLYRVYGPCIAEARRVEERRRRPKNRRGPHPHPHPPLRRGVRRRGVSEYPGRDSNPQGPKAGGF